MKFEGLLLSTYSCRGKAGKVGKAVKERLWPVLWLVLVLQLTSCAQFAKQDVASAHRAYMQQNYGLAYHELQKAARYGDAKAEYALGYLYYTGVGAPYDAIKARIWLLKSAEQKYQPAIYALQLIERANPQPFATGMQGHAPLRDLHVAAGAAFGKTAASAQDRSCQRSKCTKARPRISAPIHKSPHFAVPHAAVQSQHHKPVNAVPLRKSVKAKKRVKAKKSMVKSEKARKSVKAKKSMVRSAKVRKSAKGKPKIARPKTYKGPVKSPLSKGDVKLPAPGSSAS